MNEFLKKIEELSFEEALKELETVITSMESGNVKLEDSVKAYEKGMALKAALEKKLNEAKLKIEKISVKPDGNIETEGFNP